MKPRTEQGRIEAVAKGVQMMLEGLGLDLDTPHLTATPERVARAWVRELAPGVNAPPPVVTMFPHEGSSQMVILHDIPVRSICAHHLLPFLGTAVVGYIPGRGQIFGISKLSRIVDYFARRPQVQEDLTNQVASFIWSLVRNNEEGNAGATGGVGVFLRCNHMCMELRGVEHPGNMTTSALRGVFEESAVREEFMRLALK